MKFYEFKKTVKDYYCYLQCDIDRVYMETVCPSSTGKFYYDGLNEQPSQIIYLISQNKLTLKWYKESKFIKQTILYDEDIDKYFQERR